MAHEGNPAGSLRTNRGRHRRRRDSIGTPRALRCECCLAALDYAHGLDENADDQIPDALEEPPRRIVHAGDHQVRRSCLECGQTITSGSRCGRCRSVFEREVRGTPSERGYTSAWRAIVAAVLREHRARFGNLCPGWQRPAHTTTKLVGDHIIPLLAGGLNVRSNCQPLCVRCNARKSGHYDGPRQPGEGTPRTVSSATAITAPRRKRTLTAPRQTWIA